MSRKVGLSDAGFEVKEEVVGGGESEGHAPKGVNSQEITTVNNLHATNLGDPAQRSRQHPPQAKRRMSMEMAMGALQQTVDKPVSFMIKLAKHK